MFFKEFFTVLSQVLLRAMVLFDNGYNIPNLRVEGKACRTNIPSCTAFRGFGGPQAMLIMESIMSEVATKLNMTGDKVL